MAALDAPRDTPRRGLVRWFPNMPLGVVKIWAGGMVGVASTGLIGPLSDTTYTKFVGRAPETVDNTGDEDLTMSVERGEFFVNNSGTNALTVAHVGPLLAGLVEWEDDNTAANATDTGNAVGGTVTEVTSDGVWIESP
jgi:hypothetical protein